MNIDVKAFAKCANCARWTKPLETSACYMTEDEPTKETLPFNKNAFGDLYCNDFKIVLS